MKILIFLKKWAGGVGVVVNSLKKEFEKKGIEVSCVSREEDLGFKSAKNLILQRKKYKEIILRESPDVIYTQDWSLALPLLFPLPLFWRKHYCCYHGNQLGKTKIFQDIIGRFFGRKLIVVGDSLKKRFPQANLIYNGVDFDKFKNLKQKRGYLGWINKETEILNKKDILVMAEKLKLKPLIAEKFSIPFEKMNKEFYNKCKIFISLPPHSAGFNLCWVEAMASEVPLVVGNNEGIGWKLPIEKVEIKENLLLKIKDAKLTSYRSWLQDHKEDFSWEGNTNKLVNLWEKDGFKK